MEETVRKARTAFGHHQAFLNKEFFWPGIDAMDVDNVYFHQDGAT